MEQRASLGKTAFEREKSASSNTRSGAAGSALAGSAFAGSITPLNRAGARRFLNRAKALSHPPSHESLSN